MAQQNISDIYNMPRLIDLNTIGSKSRKLIRNELGVKNINALIKLAEEQGVNIGKRRKTQKKRTYQHFGAIYNFIIEEERDFLVQQKKKTKAKKQAGIYSWENDMAGILNKKEFKKYKDDQHFGKSYTPEEMKKKTTKYNAYTLTLISRVYADVRRTWTFSNYWHMANWIGVITGAGELDSSGLVEGKVDKKLKAVFEEFSIIIKPVKGGRAWGENTRDTTRKITFKNYEAKAFDPATTQRGDNNCGIRCVSKLLNIKVDTKAARKGLNVLPKTLLTAEQVSEVYKQHGGSKSLTFIDPEYDGKFDLESTDYILLKDQHYTIIVEVEFQDHQEKGKKKQKGNLAFDIETRTTKQVVMVGETESYVLKSAILSMVYQPNRGEKMTKTFATDMNQNCCEKFLEWLGHEANAGHYYNCVAHNGSRFDFYLLMAYFNDDDLLQSRTQLRGTSIIGLQYKSHTFKDSCCFLTDSLSNLCGGYLITPEEKAFSKLTNIKLGDKTLTNYQLCFYKPELDFWEFMGLEQKEPDFWREYVKYCEFDCESLFLVWSKFKSQVNSITGTMGDWLKSKVSLNTTNTIGSLSKKMIDALNKSNPHYHLYCKFLSGSDKSKKYEFIKNFKRGGISHSNQVGFHKEGLCGFDIKSQYPTALMHMKIPAGVSRWVNHFEPEAHGFYHISNLVWTDEAKKFKPIASKKDNGVLDWASDNIKQVHVDSYMIHYLMKNCGLVSFDVIEGLVSDIDIESQKLFGTYVGTLYKEKAQQDALKDAGKEFNKPYREAIKLLLNSLTGKLVEDPSRYFKLEFKSEIGNGQSINGMGIDKIATDEEKMNDWVVAGVMVYSYSKRILWDYVNCLPNKSDDVIHIETDGIYFGLPNKEAFVKNVNALNDPIIKIGDELGNVEEEVCTTEESFFIGKKDYMIGEAKLNPDGSINYGKSKIRNKGIPAKTIDDEGSNIDLLDKQFFIDRFNGQVVAKTFKTIGKSLYDTKRTSGMTLTGYNMTRRSTPHNFKDFKVYSNVNGEVCVGEWERYN